MAEDMALKTRRSSHDNGIIDVRCHTSPKADMELENQISHCLDILNNNISCKYWEYSLK